MAQDSESVKHDVLGPNDDIERLLRDAYQVPAVPPSLLKRLDRTLAEQWGESAKVVRREPFWLVTAARVARSRRAWPIAASLLLAMSLVVAFRGDAHALGWAAVVEALGQQPIVQYHSGDASESGRSWLSLAQEKLGQRVGDVDRMYDLRQGVVLERSRSDKHVRRMKLADVSSASARERLALAFLLGDLPVDSDKLQVPRFRLLSERSSRAGDVVELQVAFTTNDSTELRQLTLVVDPKTRLPEYFHVRDGGRVVREGAVTYPKQSPEQLVNASFPPDMPVVDVAGGLSSLDAGTSSSTDADSDAPRATSSTASSTRETADGGTISDRPPTGAASLGWSPVGARHLSSEETAAEIDTILERLWREKEVTPVARASDEELLRRVYLDLAGRTPTVMEVRDYLNDESPDRYVALVDRLLASPDHATHLATVWRNFLLPEGVDLERFGGIRTFDTWLTDQFAQNLPYDQLVRELLLAEGRLSQSGPLLFYSALKLDADQLATRTARVFLGIRLDCAQCHDAFFEPWTQDDFWGYAAFFARISRPQAPLEAVSTVMRVRDIDRGEVVMPDSEDPVMPKFLDGSPVDESPQAAARRHQLARWLTNPQNPYFARAAVNRVWAHLFGRGIVEPVDGFGTQHTPTSPELLDRLAGNLIGTGFDLRETFRAIVLSQAYQLSSASEEEDPERYESFAQMNVKMMTAEQVYDCVTVATMLVSPENSGFSISRLGNFSRDDFLQQFHTLSGRATEYQRGIPQALTLMNGSLISSATDLGTSGLLKSLEAPFFTDDQRIEVIYLATLARRPNAGEWELLRQYVRDRDPDTSLEDALADILWALLNSAEFTMNH